MENLLSDGEVLVASGDGICRITFAHPSHNAMPGAQLRRLTEAIREAGRDPEVRVVILQSAGERTFCAGASFDELSAIADFEQGHRFFMGFAEVINACRTCPRIIIGRVQGKAVGGGVGIAAAADYCLATHRADLRLSELAVGIGPFVVGPVIERKVGQAAFRQMALRPNDWMSAEWGRERGLYQEAFADIPTLDNGVDTLARQLAAYHPDALAALKAVFWEGTEDWDRLLSDRAAISGRLVLSDFTRQAIAAFKNR